MVFSSKIPYSSGLESELLMDAKGLFKTIVVKYLAVWNGRWKPLLLKPRLYWTRKLPVFKA